MTFTREYWRKKPHKVYVFYNSSYTNLKPDKSTIVLEGKVVVIIMG